MSNLSDLPFGINHDANFGDRGHDCLLTELFRFRLNLESLSVCSCPVELAEHRRGRRAGRFASMPWPQPRSPRSALLSSRRYWRTRSRLTIRSIETKLVDAGDVGNIPVNLFNDILNIPYNELDGGGLATVANSFLFTGTWWVPSSTNLWGIDPGDPTHIALIDNFIPFSAFTEGFTN